MIRLYAIQTRVSRPRSQSAVEMEMCARTLDPKSEIPISSTSAFLRSLVRIRNSCHKIVGMFVRQRCRQSRSLCACVKCDRCRSSCRCVLCEQKRTELDDSISISLIPIFQPRTAIAEPGSSPTMLMKLCRNTQLRRRSNRRMAAARIMRHHRHRRPRSHRPSFSRKPLSRSSTYTYVSNRICLSRF
jgi:hypothetical protein